MILYLAMNVEAGVPAGSWQFNNPVKEGECPIILQPPLLFSEDFLHSMQKAQKSIWVRTFLYLNEGSYVKQITEGLRESASRGLDVRISADSFSQACRSDGTDSDLDWVLHWLRHPVKTLLGRKSFSQQQTQQMAEDFKKVGVSWVWANPLEGLKKPLPFKGTDHCKIFIVDGKVAWGGGGAGNLTLDNLDAVDYAPKTFDPDLVSALVDIYPQTNKRKLLRDYKFSPRKDYQFLIDSGKMFKSLIYQTAIDLVENEREEVQFVSQYPPGGELLKVMEYKAAHGTKIVAYVPGEDDVIFKSFPFNFGIKRAVAKIKQTEIILKQNTARQRLHAKGLLGKQQGVTLLTSHNLTNSGVMLGTQEIALLVTEPQVYYQLQSFLSSIPTK